MRGLWFFLFSIKGIDQFDFLCGFAADHSLNEC